MALGGGRSTALLEIIWIDTEVCEEATLTRASRHGAQFSDETTKRLARKRSVQADKGNELALSASIRVTKKTNTRELCVDERLEFKEQCPFVIHVIHLTRRS